MKYILSLVVAAAVSMTALAEPSNATTRKDASANKASDKERNCYIYIIPYVPYGPLAEPLSEIDPDEIPQYKKICDKKPASSADAEAAKTKNDGKKK